MLCGFGASVLTFHRGRCRFFRVLSHLLSEINHRLHAIWRCNFEYEFTVACTVLAMFFSSFLKPQTISNSKARGRVICDDARGCVSGVTSSLRFWIFRVCV